MPYQPNIPAATDALRNSQSDIQGNFQSIGTAFEANHGAFNGAIPGQHVVVQMPVNAMAPNPFGATDVGLYNLAAFNGNEELFFHPANGDADYPMTASTLSTSNPAEGSDGWSYLSSGLIIKWGTVEVTSPNTSASQTITFPVAGDIPVFTTCIQVMISPLLLDVGGGTSAWSPSVTYGTVSTVGFHIRCGFSSALFNPLDSFITYLAIGY